jgi:hypothetical protein
VFLDLHTRGAVSAGRSETQSGRVVSTGVISPRKVAARGPASKPRETKCAEDPRTIIRAAFFNESSKMDTAQREAWEIPTMWLLQDLATFNTLPRTLLASTNN